MGNLSLLLSICPAPPLSPSSFILLSCRAVLQTPTRLCSSPTAGVLAGEADGGGPVRQCLCVTQGGSAEGKGGGRSWCSGATAYHTGEG